MHHLIRLLGKLAFLAALSTVLLTSQASAQTFTFTLGQFLNSPDPKANDVAFDVYMPTTSPWGQQKPVIVFIPGGAFGVSNRQDVASFAQFYANAGYVTVGASYRTAPASPWPAQIEDMQSIVRVLRHHAPLLGINGNRIAAVGLSAGGMLAGWLGAVNQPDAWGVSSKVQFVVSVAGPWDLAKCLTDFSTVNFGLPDPHTATPPPGYPDFSALGTVINLFGITDFSVFSNTATAIEVFHKAQAASPVAALSSTASPTVLVHGTNDTIVPASQSQIAYNRLQQLGVPSVLHVFPGAGHAPTNDMLLAVHNAIVNWTQLSQ